MFFTYLISVTGGLTVAVILGYRKSYDRVNNYIYSAWISYWLPDLWNPKERFKKEKIRATIISKKYSQMAAKTNTFDLSEEVLILRPIDKNKLKKS